MWWKCCIRRLLAMKFLHRRWIDWNGIWRFSFWLSLLHQVRQYCHTISCRCGQYRQCHVWQTKKTNHNCLEIAVSNRIIKQTHGNIRAFPSFLPYQNHSLSLFTFFLFCIHLFVLENWYWFWNETIIFSLPI